MNFGATSNRSISPKAIVAMVAVFAIALIAPIAGSMRSANAASLGGTTFSAQVRVTAPCYLGGVTLLGMGNGDSVEGIIEMAGGNYGQVWVTGGTATYTGGPKHPFRFTTTGQSALLACVGTPGTTMVVTYTVRRAPFIYSIMAPTSGLALAQ